MIRITRALALTALAALALAIPAATQDADKENCPGCVFWLNGPNFGDNGLPNLCITDIRVTIIGFNGSCALDGTDGDCVQESPCFLSTQVEYRSNCPVSIDWMYGPLGGPKGNFPLPPTPGWNWATAAPIFEVLGCGSPMMILLMEVRDTLGYFKFASAQFGCSTCE